jgi:hypothetical protein
MNCAKDVTVVTNANPRFAGLLDDVFKPNNFNRHCTRMKGGVPIGVNVTYAKRYMRPRATVIACFLGNVSSCGFGLGFPKWVPELRKSVFYADIVCSSQRKGGDILRALEDHARSNGAHVIALRAAAPALIGVYENHKFKRLANACQPPSRAGRLALRAIDRFAVSLSGRYDSGFYTDGILVVSSVADAWRASKRERPKKSNTLPPGWYKEEGGHGWWMSKCL